MCHNWHRCHTLSHECVSAGCIYKIKGGVAVADEAELLLCRINLSLISVIVLTFEGVSGVEERTSCAQWDKRWPYVNCALKKKTLLQQSLHMNAVSQLCLMSRHHPQSEQQVTTTSVLNALSVNPWQRRLHLNSAAAATTTFQWMFNANVCLPERLASAPDSG